MSIFNVPLKLNLLVHLNGVMYLFYLEAEFHTYLARSAMPVVVIFACNIIGKLLVSGEQ